MTELKFVFYKTRLYFTFLLLLLQVMDINAQILIPCGTGSSLQSKSNAVSLLEKYKKHITALKNGLTADTASYSIPVVFRLVHGKGVPIGQGENLTDAELVQSLQWLNDIFSGINCTGDSSGLNININFCLAKRDINGNSTSGITRYTSNLTDMRMCCDVELMKNITKTGGSPATDPFPDSNYISIWVVRSLCPDCVPVCDIGGLATSGGIVVESASLTSCNGVKVAAHEMGHYFGLAHTFLGGCLNNDCMKDGDGICDTPPVDNFSIDNYDCPAGLPGLKNSCSTDVNPSDPNNPFTTDQLDRQNNFMDYSPANCQNSFTQGQRTKMRFNLVSFLSTLLTSPGCNDTTAATVVINDTNYVFIQPPICNQPLKASLLRGTTAACEGDTLEYYTYFSCSISNQWQVLGSNKIIASTNKTIKVYFSKPGTDTIIINAKNGCGSFTDSIVVNTEKIPVLPSVMPEYLLCPGAPLSVYSRSDATAMVYAQNNSSGKIYFSTGDSIYLPPHFSDSCYTLKAAYPSGRCTAKKEFCVKMICSNEMLVPNSFTPNADGINDILKPVYYGSPGALKLISFRVYNRWGQLLFITQSLNTGWDGTYKNKPQPLGAVIWTMEYINPKGIAIQKKGYSLLLR